MNWRAIRAIIRKDLKVVLQSKAVLIPLILVPLIMLIVLPGIGGILISSADNDSDVFDDFTRDLDMFFENMPAGIQEEMDALESEAQRIVHLAFLYMMAPLYLILPLMVANVIAADSFAGEKERKTLEALIYTPTSDRELYFAKLLSPWIAAIIISVVGFVAYGVVVNVTAWGVMERIFFPNLTWIILVIWVAPATAGLGLGAMVLVSSRVNTFQEAYQMGGAVVLPVLLLLFGQIFGVIYFQSIFVVIIGLVLWLVNAAIFWYGSRTFERGALISRL